MLLVLTTLACLMASALAQPGDGRKDDKAENFPAPPAGFDTRHAGIERGKLEMIEYDSASVGVKRRAQVYTPPGLSKDREYPVLYLLHGIDGDDYEWTRGGASKAGHLVPRCRYANAGGLLYAGRARTRPFFEPANSG
jgi:hypothetical protein